MRRHRSLGLLAGLALLIVVPPAACSSTDAHHASPTVASSSGSVPPAGSQPQPRPPSAGDWTTYHRSNDRTGAAPGVPAPHRLTQSWVARLDGAVYGQPLLVDDLVIAATENDSVYGLSAVTGAPRWRTSVGSPARRAQLPCGNIDPLGVTGTPAYDASTGSVFVAAETAGARHDLVALDARTGHVRWRRSLDVTNRDRQAEQQRGALAVAGGRVYVPFGGLAGDCGDYVGYVTATDVRGQSASTHYEVPTSREGGIWAPSGVAVDGHGDVWVAVGNGAGTGEPYDGSDSVLRLSGDLSRRIDLFAPATWGSENAEDADLGSTGPMLLDAERVLIAGKTGAVYLLSAEHLGGIGGQQAQLDGCRGFGGMAWDPAVQAAFVPCDTGVMRVDVGPRALTARWHASGSLTGSPVVGGGAVFVLDPSGQLSVLAETSGATIATAAVDATSRFASPAVSGALVLVPTLTGVTALRIS